MNINTKLIKQEYLHLLDVGTHRVRLKIYTDKIYFIKLNKSSDVSPKCIVKD